MTVTIAKRTTPKKVAINEADLHPSVQEWLRNLPDDLNERITAMRGCLAHVPTSADEFARRKHEEIDLQEAKF